MRVHLSVVAALLIASAAAVATPPAPGHPVLGTWRVSTPETSCVETWDFFPDGTTHNRSADEDSYSEYTISAQLTADGYFILVDTITETNGGMDCSGQPGAPVGDTAKVYLVPRGADELALCMDEKLRLCPGVLDRVPTPTS